MKILIKTSVLLGCMSFLLVLSSATPASTSDTKRISQTSQSSSKSDHRQVLIIPPKRSPVPLNCMVDPTACPNTTIKK